MQPNRNVQRNAKVRTFVFSLVFFCQESWCESKVLEEIAKKHKQDFRAQSERKSIEKLLRRGFNLNANNAIHLILDRQWVGMCVYVCVYLPV